MQHTNSAYTSTHRACPRATRPLLAMILFMICCMATAAGAGNTSLILNGKSVHLSPPANSNFNEENWGLGIQHDFEPVREHWIPFVTASGFKDSNKDTSYYAGGGLVRRLSLSSLHRELHFDVGLVGFVMTRKDYNNNDPFVGALPVFSVGTERIALNFTYIPKVHPKIVPIWFFQLKVSLDNFK